MKKLSKIILHVGAEKTGTTTIQNFMALNRAAFLKNKIFYPSTPGNSNHTKLAIYTLNKNKGLGERLKIHNENMYAEFRSKFESDLRNEIHESNSDIVFLSAEWLHPRVSHENEFSRLRKLLYSLADDVRILLYIRRQDQAYVSYYSTSLRAGNINRFSFPKLNPKLLPYYLDYFSIIRNWVEAFGESSLKVRLFDKNKFLHGSLIRDFMCASEMAWSDEYIESTSITNQALSLFGQDLIRQFNIIKSNSKISPKLCRIVINKIDAVYAGRGLPASKDDAILFYQNFLESNEVLRSHYFPNSQMLFDDDFSEYPVCTPCIDGHLIQASLADLLVNAGVR